VGERGAGLLLLLLPRRLSRAEGGSGRRGGFKRRRAGERKERRPRTRTRTRTGECRAALAGAGEESPSSEYVACLGVRHTRRKGSASVLPLPFASPPSSSPAQSSTVARGVRTRKHGALSNGNQPGLQILLVLLLLVPVAIIRRRPRLPQLVRRPQVQDALLGRHAGMTTTTTSTRTRSIIPPESLSANIIIPLFGRRRARTPPRRRSSPTRERGRTAPRSP